MKDFLKTTIVTGTAIAMLALSSASAAAKVCHNHTGYGRDVEATALTKAVANFNANVKAHDGAQYAKLGYYWLPDLCKEYDPSLKIVSCTIVLEVCPKQFDLKKVGKLPLFKP